MRAKDFVTEDAQIDPATAGDYQKMLAFVKGSKLAGIPPDQQIGVALFKELQRQQRKNSELENELDAAEQRIDVATQRTDMYGKQLGRHQAELEREREASNKQQAAAGELDQQYADRAQASQQQVEALAARLETIKTKPGIDQDAAAALEKQIQELSKNGVSAEKYKELEQNIAAVQQMNQVDSNTMKDLIAQVNDAKAVAVELDRTKKEIGGELEKSTKDVQTQLNQLQQQLADFRGVKDKVNSITTELSDLEVEFDDATKDIVDLGNKVYDIDTRITARNQASNVTGMIRRAPQAAAQAQKIPAPDPKAISQSIVNKGVMESADDNQFFKAVEWATRK